MAVVKTKEAAETLEVSQTTVKRWASRFPYYFQKDRNGHYVFEEADIAMLSDIKQQIERGVGLEEITLAAGQIAAASAAAEAAALPVIESGKTAQPERDRIDVAAEQEEIRQRIRWIELALAQKADEVVSVQLLEHRRELEDLRQSVERLAAAVEALQKPLFRQPPPHDELYGIAAGLQPPQRKSRLLRFIPFLSSGRQG